MAMQQLVEFLSKLDKKADTALFEAGKKANANLDDLSMTTQMLVDVGKKKGYNFTPEDVKAYLEHMKTAYYTSSPVQVLMDAYCTTSCHIGSQVQKG